jgi:hypothetical protein
MMQSHRIVLNILILFSVVFGCFIHADIQITQKVHSDAVFGQSAKDMTAVIYIKDRLVRQDIGDGTSWLLNIEKDAFYFINHNKKEYAEVDFKQIEAMLQSTSPFLGEVKTDFNKTAEKVKVNDWYAEKWEMKINAAAFKIEVDLFISKQISLPDSYEKFQSKWSLFAGPLVKVMEQSQKIGGFTVKSMGKLFFMGQSINFSNETLKISEDILDLSIFELPAKYKEVDFNIWDIF